MERIDPTPLTREREVLWLDRISAAGVLVFLLLLPFHLAIKRLLPDPVGTYWKEGLLVLLVIIWGVRSLLARRLLLTGTLLDWAALAYAGLVVLRLLIDRSGEVGLWGAYMSILYLPLFWLVPQALDHFPRGLKIFMSGLVIVGGLAALGGVVEFIVDRPLLPSAELIERQGHPDVFVYGTQLRRVYFVFDSPTTLANTLALLLPLALVLAYQSRQLWERILYLAAAALMFVCTILTFSRGIWVALGVTFVALAVFKFLEERSRKFILNMAAVAGAAILIVLVVLLTQQSAGSTEEHALELIRTEYRSAPLTGSVSLLDAEPAEGEAVYQEWQLYDPIDQVEDLRRVIYTHPGPDKSARVIYQLELPRNAALRFSIALDPAVWSPEKGDGVSFMVFVKETGAADEGEMVFQRYLNPKLNPNDRRWRNYILDLSAWSGQKVDLYLIAEPGPDHNDAYDWAGWADLELGSIDPAFIEANRTPQVNPVARHITSITDWAQDESNRDRLGAWNLGLAAWRDNPLWGSGLGVTGAAAFRTMPEQAIATESQVLKALVELGIPGLLVLGFLWYAIGSLIVRTYRREDDASRRLLVLALAASMLIVFVEGWVYQNLEVKQVNAYFWTLTGMLAFLHTQQLQPQETAEQS